MVVQMIVLTVVIVIFAAWLVRRLLGITSGHWGATLAAVLIGETLTIGVILLVVGRVIDLPWYWYPIGCALVVVLSMMALAGFELGSRRSADRRAVRIPHPIRALRERAHRTRRYIQVSVLALRNGLLPSLRSDPRPERPRWGARWRRRSRRRAASS